MNEKAGVAKLADLAGEQLDPLRAVAENYRLRDVQLREEGVQAVQLLPLLKEGIVLREPLQRQLVRDFDVLRRRHVALLKVADLHRIGRTKKTNLAARWHELKNVLDDLLELAGDESVDLIENDQFALVEFGLAPGCQVEDAARSGHHDVHGLPHADDVLVDARSTCGHHALHAFVLSNFFDHE